MLNRILLPFGVFKLMIFKNSILQNCTLFSSVPRIHPFYRQVPHNKMPIDPEAKKATTRTCINTDPNKDYLTEIPD
jgi:hypothetical protein